MTRRLAQPPLFQKLMNRAMPESEWQKEVEETLDFFGWDWWHPPPNVTVCPCPCRQKIFRGVKKGFPDLLCLKPPYKPLWLELKTEIGQLKPEQKAMHARLRACGERVEYARPRDREWLLKLIANPEAV